MKPSISSWRVAVAAGLLLGVAACGSSDPRSAWYGDASPSGPNGFDPDAISKGDGDAGGEDVADAAATSVKFLTPADGATVCGTLTVEVAASAEEGVEQVAFHVDGEVSGVVEDAPFRWTWDTTGVANGPHELKAVAENASGQSAFAAIEVEVANDGESCDNEPSVQIIEPADGSYVRGIVEVKADASDDVGVTEVQFFVDNGLLLADGSVPFAAEWDTDAFDEGAHTLKVIAHDTAGQTATHPIGVTVDRTPPHVELVSPSDEGFYDGEVPLEATATDDHGVDRVVFTIAHEEIGQASTVTVDAAPWESTFDVTGLPSGRYEVFVQAYDRAGSEGKAYGEFLVDRPPQVEIFEPGDGDTLEGPTTLSFDASDDLSTPTVTLFVDGAETANLTGLDSYVWTAGSNGPKTLKLVARDGRGQEASATVDVMVDCPSWGCGGGDPCDPNPCHDPPAAACSGDSVVTYSGHATCTVAGGEASCGDDYEDTVHPCDDPPADECHGSGEAVIAYASTGSCTAGACEYGSTSFPCPGDHVCSGGECVEEGGPPTTFAGASSFVASLMFPTEDTGPCCFDFDGDGDVDNGIVDLLDSLSSFLGDTDINAQLAENIEEGALVLLFEAEGYADDPSAFLLNVYFGELAEGTDPAAALAGGGEFLVNPASFDLAGDPLMSFPAAAAGGTVIAGPSIFALNVTIQEARIESVVSAGAEQGLAHTDGRLGGLVPMQELASTLNNVANGCECLGIAGDAFLVAAEDKIGCTDAAKSASPSCGFGDGICQDLGDNLGIACTAIGIIKPDIDTDDNGTADHFSVGLMFVAVGADIDGLADEGAPPPLTGCSGCSGCTGGGPGTTLTMLLALLVLTLYRRRTSAHSRTHGSLS